MSMYAVVALQWHQYIIQQWWEITVDEVAYEAWQTVTAPVLALFNDDGSSVKVGMPYIEGASVSFDVVDHHRGDKIRVVKFQRKTRYERNFGHRSYLSTLVATTING